ncbi:hypothetical protein BJ912DRAFT_1060211 [Pholiota molesta]|nr:hypothetical protein BJ912DRAFT_1060211 [Pholiota molesta]
MEATAKTAQPQAAIQMKVLSAPEGTAQTPQQVHEQHQHNTNTKRPVFAGVELERTASLVSSDASCASNVARDAAIALVTLSAAHVKCAVKYIDGIYISLCM